MQLMRQNRNLRHRQVNTVHFSKRAFVAKVVAQNTQLFVWKMRAQKVIDILPHLKEGDSYY